MATRLAEYRKKEALSMKPKLIRTVIDITCILKLWEVVGPFGTIQTFTTVHPKKIVKLK